MGRRGKRPVVAISEDSIIIENTPLQRNWRGTRRRSKFVKSPARVMTEAAAGTLVRRDKVTLGAFLTEWLDSRRVRPNTLDGYRAALKPVIDHLGTVPLQHLDTPHLDELVTLRLTGEPIPPVPSADAVPPRCWPICGRARKGPGIRNC
jgi:hypothetical protein